MARPERVFVPGGLYHVMARGNNRQRVFLDDLDYDTFVMRLGLVVARHDVAVLTYCVMPNHYHLFVEVRDTGVSQAMSELNGGFARNANHRHGRIGHLFQSRFRAVQVARDAQLLELARYIVLNPVRAGLVRRPEEWPWSSYATCAGLSFGPHLGAEATLLRYFGKTPGLAQAAYKRFVDDGLARCQAPSSAMP